MQPTAQAVEAIRAEVASWEATDQEIVDQLNSPTLANPVPQGTVPAPVSVLSLMALLFSAEVKAVMEQPWVVDFRDAANAQDRGKVTNWTQAAQVAGLVSAESAGKVVAALEATQPDPAWRDAVSWAELTLGREVDLEDVAAARPPAPPTEA